MAEHRMALAVGALARALDCSSDADVAALLPQLRNLWPLPLSAKTKALIERLVLPGLAARLATTACPPHGFVPLEALRTLVHLVTHQAWAAAWALNCIKAWSARLALASLLEVRAACALIKAASRAQPTQLPAAEHLALHLVQRAGADVDKQALFMPLLWGANIPVKHVAGPADDQVKHQRLPQRRGWTGFWSARR